MDPYGSLSDLSVVSLVSLGLGATSFRVLGLIFERLILDSDLDHIVVYNWLVVT